MNSSEILVSPAGELTRRRRLFDAVAELYGIKFAPADAPHPAPKAIVLFSATRAEAIAWANRGVRCLAYLNGAKRSLPAGCSDVTFSKSSHLSSLFRGTRFADSSITTLTEIEREPGDDVIAERARQPVWVNCQQQRCAADLV